MKVRELFENTADQLELFLDRSKKTLESTANGYEVKRVLDDALATLKIAFESPRMNEYKDLVVKAFLKSVKLNHSGEGLGDTAVLLQKFETALKGHGSKPWPEFKIVFNSLKLEMKKDPNALDKFLANVNFESNRDMVYELVGVNPGPNADTDFIETAIEKREQGMGRRLWEMFLGFMHTVVRDEKMLRKIQKKLGDEKFGQLQKLMNSSHAKQLALTMRKMSLSKEEKKFHKEQDTFAFVGKYEFLPVQGTDHHKKQLKIENLLKVDPWDMQDHKQMNMMLLRARQHDSELYKVNLPKGVIDNRSTHHIEPWLLELIDKHKVKVRG